MIPTTWHIGETAKARRERRSDPYDGNNYYPSYDSGEGKGGHDKGKSKTFAAIVEKPEERPATQQIHMPHQDWDQSWNWSETGWRSFHEISSEGHAMTFRNTFQQNENETQIFSTKFLRHNKSQPLGNKADGTCHQPSACNSGQRVCQIHAQRAALYLGRQTRGGPHLLRVHPGQDQAHFC